MQQTSKLTKGDDLKIKTDRCNILQDTEKKTDKPDFDLTVQVQNIKVYYF